MEIGLLKDPNLLLGGDIYLIVFSMEVWSSNTRLYPLDKYFRYIFHVFKLIDVLPNTLLSLGGNENRV